MPTGVTGISYKIQQVEDPTSEFSIGFDSGDQTPLGKQFFSNIIRLTLTD